MMKLVHNEAKYDLFFNVMLVSSQRKGLYYGRAM